MNFREVKNFKIWRYLKDSKIWTLEVIIQGPQNRLPLIQHALAWEVDYFVVFKNIFLSLISFTNHIPFY